MENTAQLGLNSSPPLMLSDPELFLVSKLHLLPDAECVACVLHPSIVCLSPSKNVVTSPCLGTGE